jgi:glycosyltransferase involved in cell wall biosynthesis
MGRGNVSKKNTGDFLLLDKKGIEALQLIKEDSRNTKALFSWIGYKKKDILYSRAARQAGNTKWNYIKLVELAIDGILSFTTVPLRRVIGWGFIVASFAFVYSAIVLIKTLILGRDFPGYALLMIVILFLGGIQLISIGILGEYVGRIFIEAKSRPLYLIESIHMKSVISKRDINKIQIRRINGKSKTYHFKKRNSKKCSK